MTNASIELGEGGFKYKVAVNWETVPPGYAWREVAAVAAASKDNVYVFNRGPHPMIVFDSDGNFLKSWGENVFSRPHGVSVGPNDTLYCTDDGDHTVRQCTLDGKVLMTIGVPGKPAEYQSGQPFNRCTHVALDPKTGELYVSDGYGNSRIHKFTPDGNLLFSWGGPGTDPGEFNIPHNIATDNDGYVYVADRESHRVQIRNSMEQSPSAMCSLHNSRSTHLYRRTRGRYCSKSLSPEHRSKNYCYEYKRGTCSPYWSSRIGPWRGSVCRATRHLFGFT